MAEVSFADLSGIKNSINDLANRQSEMNQYVKQVGSSVEHVNQELIELTKKFEAMMDDQKKSAALQQATTELVRVRQEIESEFSNYKIVRKTMLGVLQATDLALVKKTTISNVSEELMLSTPKYWLAPCLVAISAWIGNDRDLAERAIAEAVKRDEERTALTMALICRRNNRVDTCYEWLSIYFANQDSANFSEGTFTYIDAYVNGVFGPDSKHMCDDYIEKWINEIKGRSSLFEQEQEDVWKNYCTQFAHDIGDMYPAIKSNVAEYNSINAYVGRVISVDNIADNFNGITNAYVDQEQLKKTIDNNLINLISRYDEDEEPLRKEEAYYTAVKYYEGDTEKAKQSIRDAEKMRQEKTLNLVEQMSSVIDSKKDMAPSKKKTAVSFLRNYIKKGFDSYITENKGSFPESITLNVNGWVGKTADGNNYTQMCADYDAYLQGCYQNEKAAIEKNSPKVWKFSCIALAVLGLIMCCAVPPIGIIMLIGAGVCGVNIVTSKKKIEKNVSQLNERYNDMSVQGKEQIKACVEQWNQIKNVTYQFNSKPIREIIA